MAGKQAKILSCANVQFALAFLGRTSRYPDRDRCMVLLSVKAGLRAGEIAALTWPMVLGPDGRIGDCIELHDCAAKKRSGRTIPIHPKLRSALIQLRRRRPDCPHVIVSERGDRLSAASVVNWFWALYRKLGFAGCSSHSGRRTFITRAARVAVKAGGTIRDVQQLAGHRDLNQTQVYIEADTAAKRRLVAMV